MTVDTPRGGGTRERLIAVTRHLLAAGDGGEVTLRAITTAAEANVAAVSYHFGSKDRLCAEVVDRALRDVVDAQLERYAALGPGAQLEDLAAALVAPVVEGLTGGDADGRALLRIAARSAADASSEAGELARGTTELARRLEELRPGADELERHVRLEAAGAILRSYALGPLGPVLSAVPPSEAQRRLVEIVVGVWGGRA